MPLGKARRMSPRASTLLLVPEAEASAPLASPGRRQRAGGGDARPVHNTAEYPFQDVMAQCGVYSKGRTPHPMVNIGRVERRATVTLPGRGVGGHHADTKAVRTSPLSSSRALVRASVSSHAEGRQHAQLSKQEHALCFSVVLASKDSCGASA
jgi:hypothetical protein